MNIGKAIRLCRTQKDMSRSTLADRSGISESYLSLLERGKRDPSLSKLNAIASALGVPVSVLVFVAADSDDMASFDRDLAEKLSFALINLVGQSNKQQTLL